MHTYRSSHRNYPSLCLLLRMQSVRYLNACVCLRMCCDLSYPRHWHILLAGRPARIHACVHCFSVSFACIRNNSHTHKTVDRQIHIPSTRLGNICSLAKSTVDTNIDPSLIIDLIFMNSTCAFIIAPQKDLNVYNYSPNQDNFRYLFSICLFVSISEFSYRLCAN